MSTQTGNPLAAHVGDNQFAPQAVYGDIEAQAALTSEAPISGAPTVPQGGPAAATAPAAAGPAPLSTPAPAPGYHAMLAETWGALASLHGASPVVKQMAKLARKQVG